MRSILILWLFLIPFCFINLSINVFVVYSSHCLSHQKSALLRLRSNLIFNPSRSKKLVHWNQSHDCCQWNGVTCDKGQVIALDLREESISGELDSSSSLFNLQFLQNLNLAYNEFHSVFPSEFQKLKNLRYLNLSNAGFKGQIPIEISYLTKLISLDLSTSLQTLKLEEPNVTMLLKNFTEIKALYLDGIKIFATGKEWSQAVSALQNLQILSMSSCNLFGPIDSSLAKLQSLSVLQLSNNNMASSVPKAFVGLTNLTTLQLRNCNLSGDFPKQIFQMPNLQVLDVSDNRDLQGSLPNFQHHEFLQSLNLSHTKFSGQLPGSIQNLRKLSALAISNTKFNGTLPCSISKLTSLAYLDLSFNNFTGSLPSFNMSKSLTYLSLYHNDLRGEVSSVHFTGLENLVTIDLGGNLLNGRVPSSLFTLPSLHELILSNNRFEGLLDEFPNASSSPLEILDISGNNLQGPVPVSIFHLKRLTLLQLSSNKFNGTIHLDMMRSMENLATLDLAHNNLLVDTTLVNNHNLSSFPKLNNFMLASCKLKEFPSFLRNQSNLLYLDLSSNQIQETIPNWIWRFDFMVFLNLSNNFLTDFEGPFQNISSNVFLLDLHSNQLKGHPPIFPKNVIYLDYSSNRFSSIAPPDIGNRLPFTYFLSLSNNSFHGKIHESLCNMSALRVLDLSENNFSDTIPVCLTKMSNTLRVLNLAGNNLKGQISNTFSTFCALRFLDLNENLLGGTIPNSLANCQKLQVLNLGNNQLTDRYPCFLGNLSTLRVMILRSNKFFGTLDCPNSIGKWETLQIVDLASNNFSGSLPIALLQSWKALTIPDEDESGSEFGQLSFDIYDNVNHVDFKNALSTVNKDLAPKLARLIAVEPPFVISHLFSDIDATDFGRRSYLDSVTIVIKGRQLKLIKILTAFTSLDFSSNHFEGPIPKELMNFKALHALNLSQNSFSGHIPSSIGNLKYLESLDLSMNSFRGNIPTELASLCFLEFLNVSYNHLIGQIPTGTQIQSFEADSFKGNKALCGPPLTQNCSLGEVPSSSTSSSKESDSNHGISIDWNFLSAELGFTFGLGIIILPLIFCQQWRLQYSKHADHILWKTIPQLDFVYERRGGKTYRSLRWKPF
ncbi:receptor-like protein 7 [Prosopis cineraria]|uniref:receptor-like protein 7 n=1 Tax=Prosopis cineraria TaxID=364024 RepID=UPI0024106FEB|nr:receptor-like protein 7 [Prosopis cineraria]